MHRAKFSACLGFVFACISLSSSACAAMRASDPTITGVYNGSYRCARGPVNLKLTLAAPGDGSLTGIFVFDLPASFPTHTASYTLSGKYDAATGKFHLNPVKWEPPAPAGYVMVGMEGTFNSGTERLAWDLPAAGQSGTSLILR